MISDGFNFGFAASNYATSNSTTVDPSISSSSINPSNQSNDQSNDQSNVFANHAALHANSAVQENAGEQTNPPRNMQQVTNRLKRKFSCVLEDSWCEEDDDGITITTGFEDGVLASVLSKQTEFDEQTFLEQVIEERLAREMNRWEQIKQQTIEEMRANGETSNGLADDRQERIGDTRRQLTFN